MSYRENLQYSIWGDFERTDADIFTPQEESSSEYCIGLPHGMGLAQIVSSLSNIQFATHYVCRNCSIALDQKGLILIGNLTEFSDDALRLLRTAGYTGRFEVTLTASGHTLVDHQADLNSPLSATDKAHIGLIFRGQDHELSRRPTLLFAGTSPLGILAGTIWASQHSLADTPAPSGFPNSPIEAVVRIVSHEPRLPTLGDLVTDHLVCGSSAYDKTQKVWKETVRLTPIKVYKEGGEARVIMVGDHQIVVKDSDVSKLLLLLIERSLTEKWTTIQEAQRILDGTKNPGKYQTMRARKSDIAHLSPDPNFVQTSHLSPDGNPSYLLKADIVIIESNA